MDAVTHSKEKGFLLSGLYICMQKHAAHMQNCCFS